MFLFSRSLEEGLVDLSGNMIPPSHNYRVLFVLLTIALGSNDIDEALEQAWNESFFSPRRQVRVHGEKMDLGLRRDGVFHGHRNGHYMQGAMGFILSAYECPLV